MTNLDKLLREKALLIFFLKQGITPSLKFKIISQSKHLDKYKIKTTLNGVFYVYIRKIYSMFLSSKKVLSFQIFCRLNLLISHFLQRAQILNYIIYTVIHGMSSFLDGFVFLTAMLLQYLWLYWTYHSVLFAVIHHAFFVNFSFLKVSNIIMFWFQNGWFWATVEEVRAVCPKSALNLWRWNQ